MKKNIIRSILTFIVLLTLIVGIYLVKVNQIQSNQVSNTWIVQLNEVDQLLSQIVDDSKLETEAYQRVTTTIDKLQQDIRQENRGLALKNQKSQFIRYTIAMYGLVIVLIIGLFSYIYLIVVRPFERLTDFASEVAKGNFNIPIRYERKNLFGAFTWAFDNMRIEVMRARAAEKTAIENNKTVIATISHDIKTPIASIRAYAEALNSNMDTNEERKSRYYSTIMRKCDEVTQLTNDLFLHALSDLQKLEIHMEKYLLDEILPAMLESIQGGSEKVRLLSEVPSVEVAIDVKRLEQILENLIENASKYAPDSYIDVKVCIAVNNDVNEVNIMIQDYGQGICDSDMPFVFDKFYRGKNVENKQGAGLGLYIVKYLIEEMKGRIVLENNSSGLCVNIWFPCVIS